MSETVQFEQPFDWNGPSSDPNDEQFGDIVETIQPATADEYNAILVGEPYDGAVIGRRGAREGPEAIRDALSGVKTHHFENGPVEDIGDRGNIEIPDGATVSAVQKRIRRATTEIHELSTIPVFLGGDNSLTYPNVLPVLEASKTDPEPLGVINIDAHLDCREVLDEPSSGTPYRQLLDAGLDELVTIGARQFETSTAYADFLEDTGGTIITAEETAKQPVEVASWAREALDVENLYVSVDMDVLDGAVAPGVSAPTPGGVTARELFVLVSELASDDTLVGFEVVETAPPLCPDGRTAETAARVIAHALSAMQSTVSNGGAES